MSGVSMPSGAVEGVARAIRRSGIEQIMPDLAGGWENEPLAEAVLNDARAALAALHALSPADRAALAAALVPEGFAVVPREFLDLCCTLAGSLKDGFVVCQRCGDQETTGDMDFVPEFVRGVEALPAPPEPTP